MSQISTFPARLDHRVKSWLLVTLLFSSGWSSSVRAEALFEPPIEIGLAEEKAEAKRPPVVAALPDLRSTVKYVMDSSVSIHTQTRVSLIGRGLLKLFGVKMDGSFFTFGQGSGVIFDREDGLIFTAAHVIENFDRIMVILRSQDCEPVEVEAKLLAVDFSMDAAVLSVEPETLSKHVAAQVGSSDNLEIGEWVIAVGDPIGFTQSASLGILSGKKRDVPVTWSYGVERLNLGLLQSDAIVMPGSSGGALFSADGYLVGINVAQSGGITFSVPINAALTLVPAAREILTMPQRLAELNKQ